jgi:hypothetical protein
MGMMSGVLINMKGCKKLEGTGILKLTGDRVIAVNGNKMGST